MPIRNRIALMGPFGFGNLGDAATQQAMIENIRLRAPQVEIFGLSLNPSDTQQRHGIQSFPIGHMANDGWLQQRDNLSALVLLHRLARQARAHPSRVLRVLGRFMLAIPIEICGIVQATRIMASLDQLIISGGGQLDDYWGGPWHHPYTLLLWSLLAKLSGVSVAFVSVGAGPIDHPLSRWLIKRALSLADYRSFRDVGSKQLLARMGFDKNDSVVPDLAHSLDGSRYSGSHLRRTSRPLVGVGPMAYFDSDGWPQHDRDVYVGYLSKLATIIEWLLDEGSDVLLFTGEATHDRRVVGDLRGLLSDRGVSQTDERVIELPIDTVDDLMAQLAATDFIIASRFHGVLLSLLLNKPVLALSYHPKIDDLMEAMGQREYCMPIDRFGVAEAQCRFLAMAADAVAIKDQLATRISDYRTVLAAQYDQLFGSAKA